MVLVRRSIPANHGILDGGEVPARADHLALFGFFNGLTEFFEPALFLDLLDEGVQVPKAGAQ
jgi:hypothetical protein